MRDDIVIIGGGPAGMTAALYAGRAKFKTRLCEKASVGGQVLLTESVENFPGVVRMNASDWVEAQKKQLVPLSDVTVAEEMCVKSVVFKNDSFYVQAVSGSSGRTETFEARAVIVATGAYPKRLQIPGENELTGRGVSYCATCDGPLYRGKDVVVVGGGDSALEEALYLAKLAKKVTLVHRRDAFRAVAVLQERVHAHSAIELALASVPVAIEGVSKVEGVRIRSVKEARESVIPCEGIFIFVGSAAGTAFLDGQVAVSKDGRIVTDEFMMTSRAGIFACGDCRQRPLYQIVTACSDGAIAAHAAGKYLERFSS
jgi:thioredoxin reductase (NADPH)